jgi:hypothetical protein
MDETSRAGATRGASAPPRPRRVEYARFRTPMAAFCEFDRPLWVDSSISPDGVSNDYFPPSEAVTDSAPFNDN